METLKPWLSEERRFWRLTAVLVGVLAVCRGLGPANPWITTQAQIDYSEGFAKRALFGEIFAKPLHLYTVGRFTWLSLVFLALTLGLLALFLWRSGVPRRIGSGEIAAVFWSSSCLTFFVDHAGYFDVLSNDFFFIVLSNSLGDNLRQMRQCFYTNPSWWRAQLASVVLFSPARCNT